MDMEVKCAWCGEKTTPVMKVIDKQNGKVKERRCSNCGKILAAYLDGEGDFIKGIRKFEN